MQRQGIAVIALCQNFWVFYKHRAQTWRYISLTVNIFVKLRDFFLDKDFLKKNLSHFVEIHFHLARYRVLKRTILSCYTFPLLRELLGLPCPWPNMDEERIKLVLTSNQNSITSFFQWNHQRYLFVSRSQCGESIDCELLVIHERDKCEFPLSTVDLDKHLNICGNRT